MASKEVKSTPSGKYVKIEDEAYAFVPNPLPLKINYDKEIISNLVNADKALSELKGFVSAIREGISLPISPYYFVKPYHYREAYWSTRLEGTNTTFEEAYAAKTDEYNKNIKPDVIELWNYIDSLVYGINELKNRPISYNLIKDIHRILLTNTRGRSKSPGEFRKTQVRIGGNSFENARYIPPPVPQMMEKLDDLEKYINLSQQDYHLIQCAIIHAQFEMIHPFYDGNGRVGRILINLFLYSKKYTTEFLFLSEYFDNNKQEYFSRLRAVSQKGEWAEWVIFFLRGIIEKANDARRDFSKIVKIYTDFQNKIKNSKGIPKFTDKLIDELFINPVVSISRISKDWNVPYNLVKRIVKKLVDLQILTEYTTSKRNRQFLQPDLLDWMFSKNES